MAYTMTAQMMKTQVAPILAGNFDGIYKNNMKNQWKAFSTEISAGKSNQLVETMIYGFGTMPVYGDGTPTDYDQGGELYNAIYFYQQFGLCFALTEAMMEDETAMDFGKTFSEHLAISAMETQELNRANVLNRAFNSSYPLGDGKEICSSSHPGAYGNTYSNLLTTAALSQTSLESAYTTVLNTVDPRGKRLSLSIDSLVVPSALVLQGNVLTETTRGRTGTNNNDKNPLNGVVDKCEVVQRLSSATAWFLKTSAPKGIQTPIKRKPKLEKEGDFNTGNMRFKSTFREVTSCTNPLSIFGNAGA